MDDETDVLLYGYVGYDWDGMGFTARGVVSALAGRSDVTIRLNSGGGIATEGAAIHAILKAHPGAVTIVVEGIAASAASLIAMAADTLVMSEGALLMIHDPRGETFGTSDDHTRSAEVLDKMADSYAAIYAARAGIDVDAARALMKAETWFTAAEAVEAGFADEALASGMRAAAAFDFRVYANAPRHLVALAEQNGWQSGQTAIRASAPSAREVHMDPITPTAAASTADIIIAPPAPAAAPQPAATMHVDPSAAAAERRRKAVVARFGDKLTAAQVENIVAQQADEAAALMAAADVVIAAQLATAGPELRPATRILRDEVDTRRVGMEAAIVAQLGRTAPEDDRGRAFMSLSLVEMAAQSVDYRGPLRTVADRERALMSAAHSTSDFPRLLENALNKRLLDRYQSATPTYQRIADRISFNDFRPHPMLRAGDFPTLQPIGEGGEIKYGTFGESKETVAVSSYAVAVRLSRQLLINDDMMAIDRVVADRGLAVARFEDRTFYAMALGGANSDGPTLATTTRQVFNTTDGSKAGTAAAITVASLAAGRAAMRKRTSIDGERLDITASILLVGPDKETEGQQIVAPIQAQQAGNVNPFSGTLSIVTTAEITGNAWYLFADPSAAPVFVYGYLSGYEAPRLRTNEPFGQQGMEMSLEHDFGVGAIDFRGGYKNAGA